MDHFQCSCNEHFYVLYSKGLELSLPNFILGSTAKAKNSFLPWVQYLRGFKIFQRIIGSYFIKEAISYEFEIATHSLLPT